MRTIRNVWDENSDKGNNMIFLLNKISVLSWLLQPTVSLQKIVDGES